MNTDTQPLNSNYGVRNQEQVARILNFPESAIPVLVKARVLSPLGDPAPNAPKWFAATEIMRLAQDPDWLDKATRIITRHWQQKNRSRRHVPRSRRYQSQ